MYFTFVKTLFLGFIVTLKLQKFAPLNFDALIPKAILSTFYSTIEHTTCSKNKKRFLDIYFNTD